VEALQQSGSLAKLTHIVITQMDAKAVPTLQQVLAARLAGAAAGAKLEIVLSNPALQLLQNAMGGCLALPALAFRCLRSGAAALLLRRLLCGPPVPAASATRAGCAFWGADVLPARAGQRLCAPLGCSAVPRWAAPPPGS
jgi:hypothetical protein